MVGADACRELLPSAAKALLKTSEPAALHAVAVHPQLLLFANGAFILHRDKDTLVVAERKFSVLSLVCSTNPDPHDLNAITSTPTSGDSTLSEFERRMSDIQL